MDTNSTVLIKVGGLLSSSSVMSNMVIFNDPAYLVLAIFGAFLSFLGMLHEIVYKRVGKAKIHFFVLFVHLIKAVVTGGILTPMFFMFYINSGGELVKKIVGLEGMGGVFNSFWFLLSLITAWFSPLVWDFFIARVKRGGTSKNGK
jgi:hypothetical protein